jgi:hypothetical protein
MPKVLISTDAPRSVSVNVEIARLRDLDIQGLRSLWESRYGGKAAAHLPRHLLFRLLAYRLQAEHLGDLDVDSKRLLDRSDSPEDASRRAADAVRATKSLRPGTVLGREWNGEMHRVAVLADGFAWNGTTYPSLSKVAFAITGTRWNGPRFFGLRDRTAVAEESA